MTIVDRYYRARSRYWQYKRLIFPSPAEVRFVEIMGGRVWRWRRLALVVSLGRHLRGGNFRREVRYGRYYVDFANDLNYIIEIDGAKYHQDVVADMEREIYITDHCWKYAPAHGRQARILRVKAYHVYNNSRKVQDDVLNFMQNGAVINRV